jgi:hypothetical protein
MIISITPIIALMPDIIIKQIAINLFPNPSDYIENFRYSLEFQKIKNSESNFIRNISNMHIQSDLGQKIELINIEDSKKIFEKKSKSRSNKSNISIRNDRSYEIKNINIENSQNALKSNLYNTENSNSNIPLIDCYKKKRDKLNIINLKNKTIEEKKSSQNDEIDSEESIDDLNCIEFFLILSYEKFK